MFPGFTTVTAKLEHRHLYDIHIKHVRDSVEAAKIVTFQISMNPKSYCILALCPLIYLRVVFGKELKHVKYNI